MNDSPPISTAMVLFAGPIVIEWYWFPIFIVLVVVLPALTVGAISEVILRARRSGPLTWAKRGRMWGFVAVALVLLSVVFDVAIPQLQEGREARATARAFDFTPHEPRSLPALFSVTAVSGTPRPPKLERHYLIGTSGATASEQRPVGRLVAKDGRCALAELSAKPRFRCRERRTPGGISVFFSAFPSQLPNRTAFAMLDGTLVRMTFEPLPEEYVLAYFDSLRPVDKDDIEFTRP